MIARRAAASLLLLFALLAANLPPLRAQQQPPAAAVPAAVPNEVVDRIKDEGLNRSQLMDTLSHLTDVIGPRLTNSPAARRANEWTRDRLTAWGLANARLEPWGPFGRGWTLKRFSAEVVEPQAFPLLAYPRAWSPGLAAPVTAAEVVLVEATNEEELLKYKGQLAGKVVLDGPVRELTPRFTPNATRLSEKQLLDLANAPDPATLPVQTPTPPTAEQVARARFNVSHKPQFYLDEGAVLWAGASPAGDGGNLQFVHSATVPQAPDVTPATIVGPWNPNVRKIIPQIALSNDHFNRLVRMIRKGERPRMTVNLEVQWSADDLMGYNTVAEIPGTDLKDELVMLGAHLDSWHTGTGATDNAAGVSVMMEAVRIIKALKLQPRRTIRIALWTGEEQGLHGSRAYVTEHFGPLGPTSSAFGGAVSVKPEHARLNVYFNVDSGTGAIRGVYLQGNEALRPIFRRWLAPFRDFKIKDKDGKEQDYSAKTITVSDAGGSDFLAFDAAGLIGLDFLQDDIEYETRTWHSSQDTYDRVVPDDVKQASIIVATFVYNAAMMDGRLPRKTK